MRHSVFWFFFKKNILSVSLNFNLSFLSLLHCVGTQHLFWRLDIFVSFSDPPWSQRTEKVWEREWDGKVRESERDEREQRYKLLVLFSTPLSKFCAALVKAGNVPRSDASRRRRKNDFLTTSKKDFLTTSKKDFLTISKTKATDRQIERSKLRRFAKADADNRLVHHSRLISFLMSPADLNVTQHVQTFTQNIFEKCVYEIECRHRKKFKANRNANSAWFLLCARVGTYLGVDKLLKGNTYVGQCIIYR